MPKTLEVLVSWLVIFIYIIGACNSSVVQSSNITEHGDRGGPWNTILIKLTISTIVMMLYYRIYWLHKSGVHNSYTVDTMVLGKWSNTFNLDMWCFKSESYTFLFDFYPPEDITMRYVLN